ncbi:MAG: hypothetical protein MJ247_07850 [Alphaproteobacteria bacterium]|nr:hypothetical protein [Alphaproteobacteria bacterium]
MKLSTYLLLSSIIFAKSANCEQLNWKQLTAPTKSIEEEPVVQKNNTNVYLDPLAYAKQENKKERVVKAINTETIISSFLEYLESSYPGGSAQMMADHDKIENDMYELIISLPKETYQYIGPFINDVPYMSERILNIPGIKETKGKFPTRIAPQMKEYAKVHGKYMSKYLYICLMPEAWQQMKYEEEEPEPEYTRIVTLDGNVTANDFFKIENISLFNKFKPKTYKEFLNSKATNPKEKRTANKKINDKTSLNSKDIEASIKTLKDVKEFIGDNKFDKIHSHLRNFPLTREELMDEMDKPLQSFIRKMEKLPEYEKLKQIIESNGFTIDTWVKTTEKIIKAYRVATITPSLSLNVANWRKYKEMPPTLKLLPEKDQKIAWNSLKLFVNLYSSTKENVAAIQNYKEQIKKELYSKDTFVLETPIYGIY